MDTPLTTTVTVPTTATLWLHIGDGDTNRRHATASDLAAMGYVDRAELYTAISELLARLATGEADVDLTDSTWGDTAANWLRHLLESLVAHGADVTSAYGQLDADVAAGLGELLATPLAG